MAKKIICPECGEELNVAQIPGHISMHWGSEPIDKDKFPEAYRRIHILLDAAEGGN